MSVLEVNTVSTVSTAVAPVGASVPPVERKARTAELLDRATRCSGPERDELINEVIVINIPVAKSLAARYRNRGQSQDELEQVACLALTKAVQAFDPERGDDLLVFAVPSILGASSGLVAVPDAADGVAALGVFGPRVLELPAEQPLVEADRRFGVGLAGVDPAGHTGDVSIAHAADARRVGSTPGDGFRRWRWPSRWRPTAPCITTTWRPTARIRAPCTDAAEIGK